MTNTQELISTKLAEAIANPIFPQLDSQLRAGRHISLEALDEHAFLMDYQSELEQFYRRYHVELIRAPEGFFYLRPKASTLIARSAMSEMEMLVGKVLCYLYLSPERLHSKGFSTMTKCTMSCLIWRTKPSCLKQSIHVQQDQI